jgi:alcohol dehydrogenase
MQNKKKYSVATKNLYPQKALLFPELLLSLPWDITLSTGLDALSQCLESIWNKNYTYLTSAIAENGIRLIFESLPVLKLDLSNLGARAKMLEASLFSGLCISKTRTAMAHAISYPLTAHYGTPHGIACSFTLSELWDYNLLQDDGRMAQLSRSLGFKPTEFGSEIFSLLQRLDFSSEFKKTIKNVDQVTSLQSEMFSPGRADNCIRSFDQDSLRLLAMNASNLWLD